MLSGIIIGLLIGVVLGYLIGILLTQKKQGSQIAETNLLMQKERDERIKVETMLAEKEKSIEQVRSAMKESFDSAAGDALKKNNDSFIDLAKTTLEKYIVESKTDLEGRKQAIDLMIKPLKENLDKQETLVKEFGEKSKQTFGWVQSYITGMKEGQDKLAKETGTLINALKDHRIRGRWGEVGLRNLIEFVGMNKFCDFTEQTSVNSEDGRLRPDVIINLPMNKKVIIDSKMPLNAYLDSLEAETEFEKENHIKRHAKALKDHIKQLSRKEYWANIGESVDFVVLYIELESAFSVALEQDGDLLNEAINSRIVIATPTTLIAMLKTISYSWQQQALSDNANQIWQLGKELYERLRKYVEHFEGVGKSLDSAVKKYNTAVATWDNRIMPRVKKFEDMGLEKGATIPDLKPIDNSVNEIIKKE